MVYMNDNSEDTDGSPNFSEAPDMTDCACTYDEQIMVKVFITNSICKCL